MPNPRLISISDLSSAGVHLHPAEAVAITRVIIDRVIRLQLPGMPAIDAIRFTTTGEIVVEGDAGADRSVERAARLLDGLLPAVDAAPEVRVPGALRIALARALGTLDLPAYVSLAQFSDALERFAAPDPAAAVSSLVESWALAVDVRDAAAATGHVPELTISDVRRARRATGLTLTEIAERSRIPVSLLRELEWGYFVNWPSGHYGRTQLVRYARAAGLDDQVVVNAVWPVLQAALRARETAHPVAEAPEGRPVPLVETHLVKVAPVALDSRRGRPSRRATVAAALAIPALIGVASIPWLTNDTSAPAEPAAVARAADAPPPAAADTPAAESEPIAAAAVERQAPARPTAPTPALDGAGAGARPAALRVDDAFSPAFATTGSAMFYHADAGTGSALMRADTDATGAVLKVTSIVNDSSKNFHARPSPDGEMIAFDSDREGERAVYVADANGQAVRRVTGEGFAAVPSWAPDGRRLAYVRAEPGRPKVWNLWIVDLDTGDSSRLTSHRVGQPWGAAWFPDGKRIAYSHEDRLIIRTLDGGGEKVYPSPRKGRLLRTPAVSPDGRRVIFQLYRDGAWMLDLADGSMRRILSDPTAEEFTWSPDGRRVAYHSRQTGEWSVWMMAAR
jgi:cytoskeletal protein RodZ